MKCRVACALLALLVVTAALASCDAGASERPNVLLLVMDTTRADRCSFLGCERPTTPHLSEFARDAVTFTDAWSPAGWTGPAHASLFGDTIVVVSDHGELLGEHRFIEHGCSLHRPALHVPLLIRAKGAFTGGRRVGNVVRLEDVAPTLLELAGLEVPAGLDGAPLTRDLAGRSAVAVQGANPGVRQLVAQALPGIDGTPLTAGIQSAYDGQYHFIRWSDGRPEELYDLTRDPGETQNLAAREPRICDLLARLLPAFD